MNILVLTLRGPTESGVTGGAREVLREVGKRWAAAGHNVRIVCGQEGRLLPTDERLNGVEVRRIGPTGRLSRLSVPVILAREYLLRQQSWADIVIENLLEVPLLTPLFVKKPLVVIALHLMRSDFFRVAPWPKAALGWVAELPVGVLYRRSRFVAISQRTKEDLDRFGVAGHHTVVVPCGFDSSRYRPGTRKSEKPTIIWVGRVNDPRKRFRDAVEVLSLVRASVPEAKLLVVGAGAGRGTSILVAGQEAVELLGFVEEETKVRLYQESWVHLGTSLKEGFGLTALEAAACGTTTICYGNCGVEIVRNGLTGIEAPPGDKPALARALVQVLSDAELRMSLGRQALEFSREYSWDKMAQGILDVLDSQCRERRKR